MLLQLFDYFAFYQIAVAKQIEILLSSKEPGFKKALPIDNARQLRPVAAEKAANDVDNQDMQSEAGAIGCTSQCSYAELRW